MGDNEDIRDQLAEYIDELEEQWRAELTTNVEVATKVQLAVALTKVDLLTDIVNKLNEIAGLE